MDGSVIRAHQHAAGACGSTAEQEALGYSQGGFSSKIHLRCDDHGQPVTFLVTVGQRHEAVMFESVMEQGAVKCNGSGRPRIRPKRVAADKGYTGEPIRDYLRRRLIGAVIPRRSNESRQGTRFDRSAYRQRNHVKRTFNRIKQYRHIATRYEKRVVDYLAMLTIASIILWL